MLTALTSTTGALQWTMVFQTVQPGAWIGGPYDSLLGNVGHRFNNQGDVCNFWRSNIVWMYCAGVILTLHQSSYVIYWTTYLWMDISTRSFGIGLIKTY